jgi:amino acid adenylation domain-containing protein
MPGVILAVLKAGAAYLPLDPAYPVDRLDFMIRDSRVRWLLVEGELPASLPQNGAELIFLDRTAQAVAGQPREDLGLEVEPGSPAYVMYTSGSTGGPRGVVISHGCVAHYVDALQRRLGLEPGDRYLHTASVAFSSSVRQLLVPLSHGAAVVVASAEQRMDPVALFREVRDRGATVIDLVPSHWRGCHRVLEAMDPEARRALLANRLRLALSASEPLLSDLPAAWSAAFGGRVRLVNMYGQTETTGIVSTYPIPPEPEGGIGVVPIGRPLPGAALYLLDGRGELAPIGAAGELCVAGPAVGQGYLGLPAETAERFVPDPFGGAPGGRLYRTGDLGRLRSDGMIEFLGRRDQQVKIRGCRVEPGEVEVALGSHEAVREAAVVLHRDEPSGAERLVAFVVPGGEPLPPSEELRAFLRRILPEHMGPAAFVPLEALPLTPNGKLDRRALPAPTRESGVAYVAPRDPDEHQLADIWQEMLGLGKVGVLENFFSLGGHSLLASMVVSRVRDTFQVELPVLALFRSPTVAGLALEVREAREAARAVSTLGRIVRAEGEEVDGMSDEQVNALLAQMLAREAEE